MELSVPTATNIRLNFRLLTVCVLRVWASVCLNAPFPLISLVHSFIILLCPLFKLHFVFVFLVCKVWVVFFFYCCFFVFRTFFFSQTDGWSVYWWNSKMSFGVMKKEKRGGVDVNLKSCILKAWTRRRKKSTQKNKYILAKASFCRCDDFDFVTKLERYFLVAVSHFQIPEVSTE